jgi:hypothetical protein
MENLKEYLQGLSKDNPNDADLGNAVRQFLSTGNENYEPCVNCGKTTKYRKGDNVDKRENYVDGSGQLCGECYNKIYNV